MASTMLACTEGDKGNECIRAARISFLTLLLALAALVGAVPARADALDGLLEVSSAYAVPENGVFQLFARVAYPVNDDIRAALKDGLMLTFDLDVVVSRERRFWMDEGVAEYTLRRELSYHAVSDRYVARDMDARNGGEQHSYATLEEALRGTRHRGRLAVPAVAAADGEPSIPRQPARRRAARPPARHPARAAVLDRRLASRE